MQWIHFATHSDENLPFSQDLMKISNLAVAQSQRVSYKIRVISHIVAVSATVLFLYLKKKF